jgi:hypothetical protein
MIRNRLVSAAAALTLAAGTVALVAAPAHASVSSITCTGWQHDTYTPGLTNNLQLITISIDDDLNVIDDNSPAGSCVAAGSAASTGQQDRTFTAEAACTQFAVYSETDTYSWNDGQSSTLDLSDVAVNAGSTTVITLTGTVTSGEFSGDKAVLTLTAPSTAFANCFTPGGVTTFDFAETLTITPL